MNPFIAAFVGENQERKKNNNRVVINTMHLRPGVLILMVFFMAVLWGCAAVPGKLTVNGISKTFGAGTIISTRSGTPVSFEELIDNLSTVRVIYVGESHTDPAHHQIQLKIIESLYERYPKLMVGMEMFDRSYQPVLDRWSSGLMEQEEFVQQTHWYANWRYNYELYVDILNFIKAKRIRLVGLNLPFHIPPKIRIGGIESLNECEKRYLPKEINTTNAAHKSYLEGIFEQHQGRVRNNFESFYLTQCVWEEVMADSLASHLKQDIMVVLAGNGHIIRKFGIPDRAFRRTNAPFQTVYPASPGATVERDYADYIWVAPASESGFH